MTHSTKIAKRPGRPTKFTADMITRVLRCAEKGMPLVLAADAAGVTYQSLITYRNANEDFDNSLREAIARGVEKRLEKIERASEAGDWRASAWLLEHCQPEHFAKNRLEVTGANGAPLAVGNVLVYLPQKDGQPPLVVTPPENSQIENENRNTD